MTGSGGGNAPDGLTAIIKQDVRNRLRFSKTPTPGHIARPPKRFLGLSGLQWLLCVAALVGIAVILI